jgi:hypothetical protein
MPCDLLYDLFLGKEVLGRCLEAKNEGGIEFEEDGMSPSPICTHVSVVTL